MKGQPVSNQTVKTGVGRRTFIKGLGVSGAAFLPAAALMVNNANAQASDDGGGALTAGDASLLRFVAMAEIIESDFWEQYWELGNGTLDFASSNPQPGATLTATGGNAAYIAALQILDMDMPQYILDNTDDEFAHANFLLAYLKSKGADTSDIDLLVGPHFRTLNGSMATGSTKKGRLTNLTQLTIDTSFWGVYRTDNSNPDLGGTNFAQAVPTLNIGQHTAIPRTDADAVPNSDLIKAIAFTAGFHFPFIEIHGTSLYPQLAQRAQDPQVLRILLSIGPTEAMHFQTWQDKAGNATPVTAFNPSFVQFVDLTASNDEHLQANLIMPEPCPFLHKSLPLCSIVRPTATRGAAMAAVNTLTANGLFIGQTREFSQLLHDLASDADAAKR
ncbi:MAG TPA: twin-arginine translocation signal domain-containing protein [Chthoniobacterales bacterium]